MPIAPPPTPVPAAIEKAEDDTAESRTTRRRRRQADVTEQGSAETAADAMSREKETKPETRMDRDE